MLKRWNSFDLSQRLVHMWLQKWTGLLCCAVRELSPLLLVTPPMRSFEVRHHLLGLAGVNYCSSPAEHEEQPWG
jgi:hypothetical protein